ncbi:Fe-S protein assembly co-chaperone HscB [Noviherbaspirillum galbum]|uniref:Co-chaperone protein HscB homolog n=1 Tax=Noviherbaspirillum galbum TaxID=2709383 RepID=A0A6B3SLU5_9BURK|nr:Fe-S protein assembly co-chaperone HscB [Noviherbaspirillum galbum]NEX61771.1 Fe-S protein assembly co-chaperone HscB [Noviherbaspirillum galbum]
MENHFDLFHLPQQFAIDAGQLDKAYREVQGRVHPDRFANATDAEKRVAMQWATRANEAYQTLKNPYKRARYLCELNGVDLQIESNTAMPGDFLMQQLEWRESLADAKAIKDVTALEVLQEDVETARKQEVERIGRLLDAKQFNDAGAGVRKLMFLEKFSIEISHHIDQLDG